MKNYSYFLILIFTVNVFCLPLNALTEQEAAQAELEQAAIAICGGLFAAPAGFNPALVCPGGIIQNSGAELTDDDTQTQSNAQAGNSNKTGSFTNGFNDYVKIPQFIGQAVSLMRQKVGQVDPPLSHVDQGELQIEQQKKLALGASHSLNFKASEDGLNQFLINTEELTKYGSLFFNQYLIISVGARDAAPSSITKLAGENVDINISFAGESKAAYVKLPNPEFTLNVRGASSETELGIFASRGTGNVVITNTTGSSSADTQDEQTDPTEQVQTRSFNLTVSKPTLNIDDTKTVQIVLDTRGITGILSVDLGDGTVETLNANQPTIHFNHTYKTNDEFPVQANIMQGNIIVGISNPGKVAVAEKIDPAKNPNPSYTDVIRNPFVFNCEQRLNTSKKLEQKADQELAKILQSSGDYSNYGNDDISKTMDLLLSATNNIEHSATLMSLNGQDPRCSVMHEKAQYVEKGDRDAHGSLENALDLVGSVSTDHAIALDFDEYINSAFKKNREVFAIKNSMGGLQNIALTTNPNPGEPSTEPDQGDQDQDDITDNTGSEDPSDITFGDDKEEEEGLGDREPGEPFIQGAGRMEPIIEIPEITTAECLAKGRFSSNGIQHVQGVFQSDKHFKNYLLNRKKEDKLGGTVEKEAFLHAVNNRWTKIFGNNPGYKTLDDLKIVQFVGKTPFTTDVDLKLTLVAEDSSGEVFKYTLPKAIKGPFGPPCTDKPKDFILNFKLDDKIPSYKFKNKGNVKVSAIVGSDTSALMTADTRLKVLDTGIKNITIYPVVDYQKENLNDVVNKLIKNGEKVREMISSRLADFHPLPSSPVEVALASPILTKAINPEQEQNKRFLDFNREMAISAKQTLGNPGIKVLLLDRPFYLNLVGNVNAAAFVMNTSPELGTMYLQGQSQRASYPSPVLDTKTALEKAESNDQFFFDTLLGSIIHEFSHVYKFVGEGPTTCPPAIHNTKANDLLSDGCRISRSSKPINKCFLNSKVVMGERKFITITDPGNNEVSINMPPAGVFDEVSQCTFANMIPRLASTAPKGAGIDAAGGIKKQTTQITVTIDKFGSKAKFLPAYDAFKEPSESSEKTDKSWSINLLDASNNSLSQFFFDVEKEFYEIPDLDINLNEIPISFDIEKLDNAASVTVNSPSGIEKDRLVIADKAPEVKITKAEFSKDSEVSIEWEAKDPANNKLLYSVFLGTSADSLFLFNGAFETTENSVKIPIYDGIRFTKVIATNGSRSTETEVVEITKKSSSASQVSSPGGTPNPTVSGSTSSNVEDNTEVKEEPKEEEIVEEHTTQEDSSIQANEEEVGNILNTSLSSNPNLNINISTETKLDANTQKRKGNLVIRIDEKLKTRRIQTLQESKIKYLIKAPRKYRRIIKISRKDKKGYLNKTDELRIPYALTEKGMRYLQDNREIELDLVLRHGNTKERFKLSLDKNNL